MLAETRSYEVVVDGVKATVRASTELANPDRPEQYSPAKAFDGELTTAWAEGSPSDGAGEWIEISFPEPQLVTSITIQNGYQKNQHLYSANNRLASVELVIDNKTSLALRSVEVGKNGTISLNRVLRTIRIKAADVVHGEKYNDLCISEIAVSLGNTAYAQQHQCDRILFPENVFWSYCLRDNQALTIGAQQAASAADIPGHVKQARDKTVEQLPSLDHGNVLVFRITAEDYGYREVFLHFVQSDATSLLVFQQGTAGDDGFFFDYTMTNDDFNSDGITDVQLDGRCSSNTYEVCPDFEKTIHYLSVDRTPLKEREVIAKTPKTVKDIDGIPYALTEFLEEFERAVLSHDKARVLELMDEEYRSTQHDELLEGNTEQFIDELFGGRKPGGGYANLKFMEISNIKQVNLIQAERGYVVEYLVEANGVEVVITWDITVSPSNRYGIYGAVG